MVRLFVWVVWALLVLALVAVVLGTRGPLSALAWWALFGYLVWRAWPAVKRDVRGLWGRRFAVLPRPGQFARGRDGVL